MHFFKEHEGQVSLMRGTRLKLLNRKQVDSILELRTTHTRKVAQQIQMPQKGNRNTIQSQREQHAH